jgi:hypothetical protein
MNQVANRFANQPNDWDRMHCFLSTFHQKVGYATIKIQSSNQGQDNEIQSDSTDSSNTQPSNWQGPNQRSLVISARVPFTTFRSNLSSGLVYCWVHSHTGFESVTSSKKVSCTVFALLSFEPVIYEMIKLMSVRCPSVCKEFLRKTIMVIQYCRQFLYVILYDMSTVNSSIVNNILNTIWYECPSVCKEFLRK